MSQLDIPDLDEHQLLCFFGRNKTEMSCMDKPQTFLNQLRDNKFILEERYEEMIRVKSIEKMKQSIYKLLDWIEKERPRRIRKFWTCVFKESIMTQYPTLKRLRDSLRDGSFQFSDGEDSDKHTREDEPMEEERGGRGKRGSFCDRDDQQGHSSSQATPVFGPLPKGGNAEIWTWGLYRQLLPVACGDQQGTLYRTKLAKGEPCILRSNKWYTPSEFEKLGSNHSSRNWKKSIHCKGTKLEKLLKNGHLKCPGYKKSKAKKSTLPCSSNTVLTISVSEEEIEEEEEKEVQANLDEDEVRSDTDPGDHLGEVTDERPRVGQNVFRVICGSLTGMLHKSRFATGRYGKSIRTEDRWLSPVEFVEQKSAAPHALWRRDIQWEGQPLSSLIERKMLTLHSEQCRCQLCHPDPQALEGQKNDDDCFVCGSEGNLVMCDHCPRSFHPECHLPRLDPSTLGDDSAWLCTFCIWNMNEYLCQMTHEETLMHPVSNHMLQCHYLLLSLYNADKDHIFAKDPCIHVRGYSSQIVAPMWLDKITEQLLDQQYTVGQLLTDIQLIFSNCDQFNQNKPEYRDMGIELKEFYEQEVEKVFRSH